PAATVGIGLVTSRPFGDSSRVMKYPCSPSELAQKCQTPVFVTLSDRKSAIRPASVIASGYESSAAGRSRTGVAGATVSCVIASVFETGVALPARSTPKAEYVHTPWVPSAPEPPCLSG